MIKNFIEKFFFGYNKKGLVKKQNTCTFAPAFETNFFAGMAELVDAYVSGAYARKGVRVRLPLPALAKLPVSVTDPEVFVFMPDNRATDLPLLPVFSHTRCLSMKTIVCLFFIFFAGSVYAQRGDDLKGNERTTVVWRPDTLFFGDVFEGAIRLDSFQVTNTGSHPYIIKSVKASCDCTVLRLPERPVMPGETAAIGVEFDSAGKAGHAQPGIVVYDNSVPNSRHILYLDGNVVPRKKPKNQLEGN